MALVINAPNVHRGGGRSLLLALLGKLRKGLRVIVVLDSRMSVPGCVSDNLLIRRVKPTILRRLSSEWWLMKNVKLGDVVLCFGNLPPLFKLRGKVSVFVQNRYLVEKISLVPFTFKTRLQIIIERLWFSLLVSHVDEFVVQTPSMKMLLESQFRSNVPCYVMPFIDITQGYSRTVVQHRLQKKTNLYDFLYVASGEPHKNHVQLIQAWRLLATDGLFPSLCLTVAETDSNDLCRWMENVKNSFGLNLVNIGIVSHDHIQQLYKQVRALIYPSTFESFGLPLIEARQAGLPVLASELDFVRDILDPEESFNPDSAVSIARAVKRFMGISEPLLPLFNADKFIEDIMERLQSCKYFNH